MLKHLPRFGDVWGSYPFEHQLAIGSWRDAFHSTCTQTLILPQKSRIVSAASYRSNIRLGPPLLLVQSMTGPIDDFSTAGHSQPENRGPCLLTPTTMVSLPHLRSEMRRWRTYIWPLHFQVLPSIHFASMGRSGNPISMYTKSCTPPN